MKRRRRDGEFIQEGGMDMVGGVHRSVTNNLNLSIHITYLYQDNVLYQSSEILGYLVFRNTCTRLEDTI